MLITSLSTLEETRRFPPGLPSSLQWVNYATAWTDSPMAQWMINSAIVSVTCVVSNLVFCSLAGYAAAIAVVLFVVIASITLIQLRLTRDASPGGMPR